MTSRTYPIGFTYKREPCTISVARNNGYCWGEVTVLRTGRVFTVHTTRDSYGYPDDDAQDAFIRALRRKHHVDGQELFALQPTDEILIEVRDALTTAWRAFNEGHLPKKMSAPKAALFERLDIAICEVARVLSS